MVGVNITFMIASLKVGVILQYNNRPNKVGLCILRADVCVINFFSDSGDFFQRELFLGCVQRMKGHINAETRARAFELLNPASCKIQNRNTLR